MELFARGAEVSIPRANRVKKKVSEICRSKDASKENELTISLSSHITTSANSPPSMKTVVISSRSNE